MHAGHLMLPQRSLTFSSIIFLSVLSTSATTITVDMPPELISLPCPARTDPVQWISFFRYYSLISGTSVGPGL